MCERAATVCNAAMDRGKDDVRGGGGGKGALLPLGGWRHVCKAAGRRWHLGGKAGGDAKALPIVAGLQSIKAAVPVSAVLCSKSRRSS